MLEQMSETGLTRLLVLGTNVIPDVKGNDGRLVVLMNYNRKSIRERKLLEGDFDVLSLHGDYGRECEHSSYERSSHDSRTPRHNLLSVPATIAKRARQIGPALRPKGESVIKPAGAVCRSILPLPLVSSCLGAS